MFRYDVTEVTWGYWLWITLFQSLLSWQQVDNQFSLAVASRCCCNFYSLYWLLRRVNFIYINSLFRQNLPVTLVTIGRKVRFHFHHTLPFMTKQKCSSAAAEPEVQDHWYQCCHFWYFTMTSDVMFSDNILMLWRQILCWLGCCYFSTFALILGRE